MCGNELPILYMIYKYYSLFNFYRNDEVENGLYYFCSTSPKCQCAVSPYAMCVCVCVLVCARAETILRDVWTIRPAECLTGWTVWCQCGSWSVAHTLNLEVMSSTFTDPTCYSTSPSHFWNWGNLPLPWRALTPGPIMISHHGVARCSTQGRLHHINDGANAPWKK